MVPQTSPINQGNHQRLSMPNSIWHAGHTIRKGQKEKNPFTRLWIRHHQWICKNLLLPPPCHSTPHCTNSSTLTSTRHSPSTPANACQYNPTSPYFNTSYHRNEGAANSTTEYCCNRYEGDTDSISADQCRRYEGTGPCTITSYRRLLTSSYHSFTVSQPCTDETLIIRPPTATSSHHANINFPEGT